MLHWTVAHTLSRGLTELVRVCQALNLHADLTLWTEDTLRNGQVGDMGWETVPASVLGPCGPRDPLDLPGGLPGVPLCTLGCVHGV